MNKSKYWIAFSSIEQLDSTFIQRMYNYFGDIEIAFNATLKDLKDIDGFNMAKAEKFLELRDKTDVDKVFDAVAKRGIKFLTLEDDDYPSLLKNIYNPPAVLYYKGDLSRCNFERTLAVVGSRRATFHAGEALNKIMSELCGTDICIVSGLAAGIDTTAHNAAIKNNLTTIGVIASGFDFIYPTSNKELYSRIENGSGVIFTEYYPTFEPLKFRFPQRNRIVSGLSYGTLVVEASLKSGALITANLALEQGRELLCIPGLITNPNTAGIYKLIKQGASIATCADDILNALGWEVQTAVQTQLDFSELDEDEKRVYNALELEEKGVDELIALTKIPLENLLTVLTMMELKGIIKQVGGDRYKKV